jgi:hypothetical protein
VERVVEAIPGSSVNVTIADPFRFMLPRRVAASRSTSLGCLWKKNGSEMLALHVPSFSGAPLDAMYHFASEDHESNYKARLEGERPRPYQRADREYGSSQYLVHWYG